MSDGKINIKNQLKEVQKAKKGLKDVGKVKKGFKNPFGKSLEKVKKANPSKKLKGAIDKQSKKSKKLTNPFSKKVKKLQAFDPNKKLNAVEKKAKKLVPKQAAGKLKKVGNFKPVKGVKASANMRMRKVIFDNPVSRFVFRAKTFKGKKTATFETKKRINSALSPFRSAVFRVKTFKPLKSAQHLIKKKVGNNEFVKAKKRLETQTGLKLLDEQKLLEKGKKLSPDQLKGELKKGKSAIPQSRNLAQIQEAKKRKEVVKKGVKKSVKYAALAIVLLAIVIAAFLLWPKTPPPIVETTTVEPVFGLDPNDFQTEAKVLQTDQRLATVLEELDLSKGEVMNIERDVIEDDGFESLDQGKKIFVYYSKEDGSLQHFVYEDSPNKYMRLNFDDVETVDVVTEATQVEVEEVGFVVQNTLMESILEGGVRYDLIDKIEETLASKVDLFKEVKPGDEFKMVYQQELVKGKVIGTGNLLAISYKSVSGKEVKGYYLEGQDYPYYDEAGRPMKSSFLLSPVSMARITSSFGPRFHPVLKKSKPHNGTDYAAPEGTPIMSVADGEVIEAKFGKFNGNYVKVKHDDKYTTQYLHMSQIGPGMVPGRKVKQGETIGFVGSTGLATGPHVCFRFWKNGVQVNHLKEDLPQLERMPFQEMLKFDKLRESMNEVLDNTTAF